MNVASSATDRDPILAAVIESSLDCIIVTDAAGRVVEFNPAAVNAFGYAREAALGRLIADLIVPATHEDAHAEGLGRYLAGAEPRVLGRRIEVQARCSDDRLIPVELAITEAVVGDQRFFTACLRDLSGQQAMETALRASEARLTAFLDHLPASIYVKDAQGRYIVANADLARRVGRTVDEVIGKLGVEITSPEMAADTSAIELEVMRTGQPQICEQSFDLKDGLVHALTTRFPLPDHEGRMTNIGAVMIDITTQKSAEMKMRESEARLAAFMENAPVAMYLKEVGGPYVVVNRRMSEVVTSGVGEILGRTTSEVFNPIAAAFIEEADRRVLAHGEAEIGEEHYIGAGEFEDTFTTRFPVRDAHGVVTHIGGVLIDITSQKRAERLVRESEARLAAFMGNAPVGMFLRDEIGRLLMANAEMQRAFRGARDGVDRADFADPEMARVSSARDDEVRETGRTQIEEWSRPGLERYASTLTVRFPVPAVDGCVHVGGFALDLTARKAAESELARSREALHQSEKLRALGSLLAGVSHELNNPLSAVIGQAAMLEEDAVGTPLAARAARIGAAAARCARIVQIFLAMARQKPPRRAKVMPNALVRDALELVTYGFRTNGIEVECRLAEGLPSLWADADQLHQVLVNLLVNSQQALQQYDGPRRVGLRTLVGRDGHVVIEISDSGPGIPAAIAQRIFEPFFTTKAQGAGTGLGLSFSLGLVEAHGGRLELVEGSSGACFRLELPVEPPQAVLPGANAGPDPQTKGEGGRVLVVDDEPEVAETLRDMLEREGFQADVSADGADAIERLQSRAYTLVVSDIRMPKFDGQALFHWINREMPELRTRIAFITGDTLGGDAAEFLQRSGCPYLEKPISPADLRRMLDKFRVRAD